MSYESLLNLCLFMSIIERKMLKSPNIVEFSISLFISLMFCYVYFEGLFLAEGTIRIFMCS